MRIGIDATLLAQRRIVGISRFVHHLVTNLVQIAPQHEYVLCYRPAAWRHPQRIWRPASGRCQVRLLQAPLNRWLVGHLDLYHATQQRLPRGDYLAPFLGTLHDVAYLSDPAMGSSRTRRKWQRRYRDVARRSRLIMTLSEFSKSEIVRLLDVSPERIRVVPLAVSPHYTEQSAAIVATTRQQYGLKSPYFLFGGGFGRRKNVQGALRAFALAVPRLPPDCCLVISGTGGPYELEAQALVRELGLDARVKRLGFIPEDQHPALMAGSVAYLFPSRLEGFGLPVLEAMACGAPVITSSTTSIPEVCGDAALLANPSDHAALAAAMTELASSEPLRQELRKRGLVRAQQFSWQRVAEMVLDLYREMAIAP